MRAAVDHLFVHDRNRPVSLIETVSIVATLALLQRINAVFVLPLALSQHYHDHGLLVRLPLKVPGGANYALMVRSGWALSPAALEFTHAVRHLSEGSS